VKDRWETQHNVFDWRETRGELWNLSGTFPFLTYLSFLFFLKKTPSFTLYFPSSYLSISHLFLSFLSNGPWVWRKNVV